MPSLGGLVLKLSPHHHKAAPSFALDPVHSQYEVTRGMDTDGGKEDAQDIEKAKEKNLLAYDKSYPVVMKAWKTMTIVMCERLNC